MQWMDSHTPPRASISGALHWTTIKLSIIADTIATTSCARALEWTATRRHFLATFLAAADLAVETYDFTRAHKRETILSYLNGRVAWHASMLYVERLQAVHRDGRAEAMLERLRATLSCPAPQPEDESTWVAEAVWSLFDGLCQTADGEMGSLHIGAHPHLDCLLLYAFNQVAPCCIDGAQHI